MNAVIGAGYPQDAGRERTLKNYEILVPQERCRIDGGGGKYALCEGQFAVIPPSVPHRVTGKALHVSLEMALLPFREIKILDDGPTRPVALLAGQAAEFLPTAEISAAAGGLLVAYVRALSGADKLTPVVETVKTEIEKHVSDPLYSLEDSLKKLPLNYDYVRKLFKKEMGATPHEYLLGKRMELARALLESGVGNRYSNYSVAQVAEACGFSDPLYFSRVYKKFYGQAPSLARSARKA